MRIAQMLLVGLLCVSNYAAAQGCMLIRRTLPDDLRASFEERFSKLLASQAEEHWEDVAELIGRCRYKCNSNNLYTSSYKACLVSRMQEVRLVGFDFSIKDLSICTATLEGTGPATASLSGPAAEQFEWYLTGTARFQTSAEEWMEQTKVVAYLDQGQWYFIPPQSNMQDRWEKAHFTKADFARDRPEEIEVWNSPSSPVEITDVHVYMDRQYPSHRNMTFKLRNKTSKKVRALIIWFHNETVPGEVWLGAGPIQPKGQRTVEDAGFSPYGDFCEGTWKQTMLVEEVDFADGSKWEFKQRANQSATGSRQDP